MKKWTIGLLSLVMLAVAPAAQAAAFPTKDVKVIVPFAPGGGVDVTVRMLGEVAPKYLGGKKLIVENLPGGGAVTGQTAGAKAKPDGYTLLAYTSSVVSNPMQKKTAFTYKDFAVINMYCFDPEVLVVPANSQYKTLKEFVDASKKKDITMATPGHSTSHHMAALMMQSSLGSKFSYIHTSSAPQQVTQLLGGHVESAMMALGEVTSYLKDGSLRIVGIMSDTKFKGAENLTPMSSVGFKQEWGAFRGIAAPAKTPKDVVKTLSDAFEKMTKDPDFIKRMESAGYPVAFKNAAEFSKYVDGVAAVLEKMMPELKKQQQQ